jgi:ribosomal protein S18 acetylase RimI-like enzyme
VRKLCHKLEIVSARRRQYLLFSLLDFRFFKNSETGNVLFFGAPRRLAPLAVFSYILVNEVLPFRSARFFAKLDDEVAGIFAVHDRRDSLYVKSLAVSPWWRRLGVATFMLDFACRLARRLNKTWVELGVLKANTDAQKLYARYGFRVKAQDKWSLTLRKSVAPH